MVPLLLFYLVTINALGFLIMLADKEKAKKGLLQNSFLQQPYFCALSILFRGQGCRLQPKFLF